MTEAEFEKVHTACEEETDTDGAQDIKELEEGTVPDEVTPSAEGASQADDGINDIYVMVPPAENRNTADSDETGYIPQNTTGQTAENGSRAVAVIAAVILIIAIIGSGGFFYWYNLPQNRVSRLMKSAEEHLSRSETVDAAADYRSVLEIMPDSIEAENCLYSIWSETVTAVMDLVDLQKFEEAMTEVRLLPQIDPTRETMNHSAVTVIYREWASDLARKDDPDGVERLLSKAASDLSSSEIEDIRKSVEDTLRYFVVLKELYLDSQELISLHEAGNAAELFGRAAAYADKIGELVDLGGTLPFVYSPEGSGTQIGFYRYMSDIQFVIGDIDEEGKPRGEVTSYYGEYFGSEDQFLYSFTCKWSGGRPNGYCVYREYGADAVDEIDDVTIKGDVVDGKWDGETEELFRDGETYYISYSLGKVVVISENGTDANVVGYNSSNTKMITFSDAAVSGILGVPYIFIY